MKRRIQFSVVGFVAAVAALTVYAHRSGTKPVPLPPGNITAYQISPYRNFDPLPQDKLFYQWPILDSAVPSAAVEKEIRSVLSDASIFDSDASSKACFDPRLAFRVDAGSQTMDLAVCLHCDNMQIYKAGKATGFRNLSREGHRELENLTYQLFPDADATDLAAKARSEEIDRKRSGPASVPSTR